MVDLGDLREGIWPDDLIPVVGQAIKLPGIHIKGLGTNLACFAGVFLGTAIGIIPGIGALAAISLLMPLTFAMEPTTGIVMLDREFSRAAEEDTLAILRRERHERIAGTEGLTAVPQHGFLDRAGPTARVARTAPAPPA